MERRRILEALAGWVWEPLEEAWREGLVRREGHAIVRTDHTEGGFKLGFWVANRRMEWRKGRLSEERRRMLEAFPGWVRETGRRPAGHRRPGRDQ